MRARLALFFKSVEVELREVVLRDKPDDMLKASPKGTVPVLKLPDGRILEESLDIMLWAVEQPMANSVFPEFSPPTQAMLDLINEIDGPFKHNLDRYKYANRYEDVEALPHREACLATLQKLDERLVENDFLFSNHMTFADIAIAPFIRQFANTDKDWFSATPYKHLQEWLNVFCTSPHFAAVMLKYPQWHSLDEVTVFPST